MNAGRMTYTYKCGKLFVSLNYRCGKLRRSRKEGRKEVVAQKNETRLRLPNTTVQ